MKKGDRIWWHHGEIAIEAEVIFDFGDFLSVNFMTPPEKGVIINKDIFCETREEAESMIEIRKILKS